MTKRDSNRMDRMDRMKEGRNEAATFFSLLILLHPVYPVNSLFNLHQFLDNRRDGPAGLRAC